MKINVFHLLACYNVITLSTPPIGIIVYIIHLVIIDSYSSQLPHPVDRSQNRSTLLNFNKSIPISRWRPFIFVFWIWVCPLSASRSRGRGGVPRQFVIGGGGGFMRYVTSRSKYRNLKCNTNKTLNVNNYSYLVMCQSPCH